MGEVYHLKGTVATYVPVVKQVTYQQIVLPSSIPVIRSDILAGTICTILEVIEKLTPCKIRTGGAGV